MRIPLHLLSLLMTRIRAPFSSFNRALSLLYDSESDSFLYNENELIGIARIEEFEKGMHNKDFINVSYVLQLQELQLGLYINKTSKYLNE